MISPIMWDLRIVFATIYITIATCNSLHNAFAAPTVDYLFSLQNVCDDRTACFVRTSHAEYTILVRHAANCHVRDSSSSFDS